MTYQVCISTSFGIRREFYFHFESMQEAEAWLTGHDFHWDKSGWTSDGYFEIELQYSDPGYRTFFGSV